MNKLKLAYVNSCKQTWKNEHGMSINHESMIVRVNRYMKQSTAMVCGSFSFGRKEEPKTTFI